MRQQEDAQEFKSILFEGIRSKANGVGESAIDALQAPFQGELLNRIECPQKRFSKDWLETFVELALDVKGGGGVQKALEGSDCYRICLLLMFHRK